MLGSGHFKYYLQNYRNLYRFSQQGWEYLNSLIKQFYFRWTQQGYSGTKDQESLKVLPIVQWMKRKLMWMSIKVDKRDAAKSTTGSQ